MDSGYKANSIACRNHTLHVMEVNLPIYERSEGKTKLIRGRM
jgi:hypothetical protein